MEVEPQPMDESSETPTVKPQLQLPPPPSAPVMQSNATEKRLYWDRSHYHSPEEQMKALQRSSCLYVGNLSFTTRSHHIRSHFARLGTVKRVVLGLDRHKRTPCGFCFVEYYQRSVALRAVALLSGTKLDGTIIRVELDAGFQQGRQYGRGVSGGQVRDDRRNNSRKRARSNEPTNDHRPAPAVSMDAALPSGRGTGHYGPTTGEQTKEEEPSSVVKGEEEMVDGEGGERDAKRMKIEEEG